MSGFVKLYRQVLDNPVFRTDAEAMAFSWLVLKASWKETDVRYKGRIITLERGQLAVSIRDMAESLERSKDWAKRFLQRLSDRDMIATAAATGVNVITICNYNEYQSSPDFCATAQTSLPRQGRDRTATQNKEGKEIKKKLKTPLPPFVLPEHIPLDAWNGFEEMRNKIRKPMTDRARNGILNELKKLNGPPGDILDQSTINCWQSVFEIKDKQDGKFNQRSNGGGDRNANAVAGARAKLASIQGRGGASDGRSGMDRTRALPDAMRTIGNVSR